MLGCKKYWLKIVNKLDYYKNTNSRICSTSEFNVIPKQLYIKHPARNMQVPHFTCRLVECKSNKLLKESTYHWTWMLFLKIIWWSSFIHWPQFPAYSLCICVGCAACREAKVYLKIDCDCFDNVHYIPRMMS